MWHWVKQTFLIYDNKTVTLEKKIGLMKIFWFSKNTVRKMKNHKLGEYNWNQIFDKELVSIICKETTKLGNKKTIRLGKIFE